jgi:uncharacterized lipoprotein YehR (DUF1307 family)
MVYNGGDIRRFQYFTILLVCCLAFSALVGCGAQKEEPAMKNFENNNLSVSYPEGWSADESVDEENEFKPVTVSIGMDANEEKSNYANLQIVIVRNYKLPDIPANPGEVRKNEEIGGINFETFTETDEKDKSGNKNFYGNKNGNTIMITAMYSEINKETVEKILGTLKFKF